VLLAGARWIPETKDTSAPPPDLPGVALLGGSLAALIYTLQEGRTLGWPIWLWIVGACAAAGLLALAWMDKRRVGRGVPGLLPVHLFRVGAYSAGTLIQLCFSGSMSGFFFILTLWLQAGEGVSPLPPIVNPPPGASFARAMAGCSRMEKTAVANSAGGPTFCR
jgi:hypothetical protein